MGLLKDSLADLIRDSIADAEATREDWEGALTQVFGGEDRDSDRFWIHDTLAEDQPGMPLPFKDATVGIVDELEGGVILYVHEANAPRVIEALRLAAGVN